MYTVKLEGVGTPVLCEVVRRRGQRRAVITVREDARVRVTTPRLFSAKEVECFLRQEYVWLMREIARRSGRTSEERAAHFRAHVAEASISITRCISEFAEKLGTPTRVRIKHNRSRWGSCSSRGTMSFDYRLSFLPVEVMRYVVVHELCHLEELNHSKQFWALVERAEPDYVHLRKVLHTYSLHSFYP